VLELPGPAKIAELFPLLRTGAVLALAEVVGGTTNRNTIEAAHHSAIRRRPNRLIAFPPVVRYIDVRVTVSAMVPHDR
jgi:hypothetical protein